ncbi:MAG: Na+/H+ antiporter, partial [Eggerthellaceae bacterium]|nr:Na+/H+ antiporter [Eggerthellaceae bacterium]
MAALELALLLLATVLASAILDQLIPRISLPLIQIALGVVVGLLSREQINITLNPELFLVLFIAPLLFHEAREANNLKLWKNRRSMLSYAIGLVVAIVLAVGFATHMMIPSIPLAAAFALGAALGPTDPIAVASIEQQADIPERQSIVLKGESLLNDASGIVSFQFAVAAVVTGSFSVAEALQEFMIEFFGALVAGIALGFALVKFIELVRGLGLENTTFHVSLELITPFMAYLLGEAIGVSGIILVVACGITMSFVPRDLGPASARMSIVSTSVWQVITFALNGIVFVLLGTQLPQSFMGLWLDEGISNFHLVGYVIVITLLMHAIRFVWSLASDALALRDEEGHVGIGARLRSAGIMTLSGSKGAITLAIMFSLPLYINSGSSIGEFPQRNLLIFLACGVILMSLLLATFGVPLLAPRKREEPSVQKERDAQTRADILRTVVEELTARQTPENRRAMGQVISRYNERIERVKEKSDLEDESDDELRLKVLSWEQDFVFELIENDEVPPIEGYQYVNRISHIKSMLMHGQQRRLDIVSWWRRFKLVVRKMWV